MTFSELLQDAGFCLILAFAIHAYDGYGHEKDPSLCSYWLHHLEKISVLEEQIVHDIPAWADDLEPGVAETWSENLGKGIKAIQKKIEEDCR